MRKTMARGRMNKMNRLTVGCVKMVKYCCLGVSASKPAQNGSFMAFFYASQLFESIGGTGSPDAGIRQVVVDLAEDLCPINPSQVNSGTTGGLAPDSRSFFS